MAIPIALQLQAAEIGESSGWSDYFKVLGGLLIVLLLLYLAMRYVLPMLPVTRSAASGLIRVRAAIPLEPRKRLYLVESGGKVLLLASAENAVNLLGTFAPADFPESDAPASPAPGFADFLKRGRR